MTAPLSVRIFVPAVLIAAAALVAGGCGASLVGPGPAEKCPPEHEWDHGACVYRGDYDIPGSVGAARDGGADAAR